MPDTDEQSQISPDQGQGATANYSHQASQGQGLLTYTRAKNMRRAHRGQMTKLITKAESYTNSNTLTTEDVDILHSTIQNISKKLELLHTLDDNMVAVSTDTEMDDLIIEADDYSTAISDKLVSFRRFLQRRDATTQPQATVPPMTTGQISGMTTTFKKVNLPKLQLPVFDGSILDWPTFFDSFKSAVHQDTSIDNIHKFQYLLAHVKGEAARVIQGLQITGSNYTEAINILKERYGQDHKIIAAYMKALWELPKPKQDMNSLREFHDKMQSYIRGLKSLGKTEDSYGDLLVPIIFEKLPTNIKTQISRDHGDCAWTLPQLTAGILKEIQAAESGLGYPNHSDSTASAATFHIGSRYQKSCPFCKEAHNATDCIKVTDKGKRKEIIQRQRLCFNCLKPRHSVRECTAKGRCKICRKKHHTSLCTHTSAEQIQTNVPTTPPGSSHSEAPIKDNKQTENEVKATLTPSGGPILLKTATAIIKSPTSKQMATVNILLDEGAQRTFITERAADQLNIHISDRKTENVNLATFGASSPNMRSIDLVDIQLQTNTKSFVNMAALVVPQISTTFKNYVQSSVVNHSYLKELPLANHVDSDTFEIDLLIGADYYWSIVGDKIVRGSGPTAVSSELGYLLSGPTNLNTSVINTIICKVIASSDLDEKRVKDFWDLETLGIKESDTESNEFSTYRDEHLRIENGKYVASLPWRNDHPPLPTNFDICNKRTRAMVRNLTPELRNTYHQIIKDQEARNFIELVPQDDPSFGHYIPHHAVTKNSNTTPIRIVYDCSCKVQNQPSLNECLESGPPLTNNMVSILLRFRHHPVAFSADIEKAFLNVQLEERDRDYTKFLWLSDPNNPESDFIVYRFKSILFGSASSPFILNAVIKTHLETSTSPVAQDLQQNIYVDNLMSGTDTSEQAITYYENAIHTLSQGGFNLRSWATNSPQLQRRIQADNNQDSDKIINTLGMRWDPDLDTLSYPTLDKTNVTQRVHTKREVVRATSSLFDPLGFLSPVHIRGKIFIQKLWKSNLDWDEPLTTELVNEWTQIQQDLALSKDIVMQRSYFHNSTHDIPYELHVFADASSQAYGTSIYLKCGPETSFVMAKSRVKPLKNITLPRLELLAAVVAAKLTSFVKATFATLQIDKIILWCDSQIVLHWIHSDKKLPLFVENRVKTIREIGFDAIKYCPSKDNPADLITRGITYKELSNSTLWKYGPTWLPQGDWPICDMFMVADNPTDTQPSIETVNTHTQQQNANIDSIMDIKRFGSLDKLHRVTAYVLRFINALLHRQRYTTKHLTIPELRQAKQHWLKATQQANYSRELHALEKGDTQRIPLVRQLKLILDSDGLVRCGGRLQNADIPEAAKHPLLLPTKHHYTKLVVTTAHAHMLHAGLESTVAHIRQTYWIPKIRQAVKAVLRQCVPCLTVSGKPYRAPVTPPLPRFRLENAHPFTACGVDFTGALYYKNNTSNTNKAYVTLFTCAVTRAIHLELVTDMTSDTFLRAFRRFAARRSLPSHMISDNQTTFIAAAEEIQNLLQTVSVSDYMTTKNIQWTFIPKRAPWFGGFYERLIGITKTTLKKTLGRALLTLDELVTVLTEVEAVVNDRPMTYLTSDSDNLDPLTPSHLLNGRRITTLPSYEYSIDQLNDPDFGVTNTTLQKRANRLNVIIQQCWRRWKMEYLPALRESHTYSAKRANTTSDIRVGDVVLVHSDIEKRVNWPLAVVTELKTGADGFVRSASIRTKHGLSNRPITKLYPLEICAPMDTDEHSEVLPTTPSPSSVRPARMAALRARENIQKWANDL